MVARAQAATRAALASRIAKAAAAIGRAASRRRALVVGLAVRFSYVGAAVLLVRAGELLLGASAGLHVDEARACALSGAALCVAAVALGESRRVRWSAWLLGLAHAAAWLLAWTAQAA
jgi:hypothetical protein